MYVLRYSDQIMVGKDSPLAHVYVCARGAHTHTHVVYK